MLPRQRASPIQPAPARGRQAQRSQGVVRRIDQAIHSCGGRPASQDEMTGCVRLAARLEVTDLTQIPLSPETAHRGAALPEGLQGPVTPAANPAPVLAMRATGLRLRLGAVDLGNAIGTELGFRLSGMVEHPLASAARKNRGTNQATGKSHNGAAHHLVPTGDRRAADLIQKLKSLGIDIEGKKNGIYLPKTTDVPGAIATVHHLTQRNFYFACLRASLNSASTKREVLRALENIKTDLAGGVYFKGRKGK